MNRFLVKYDLHEIASDALRQHGLAPDFPPDVIRELDGIKAAAPAGPSGLRDLRALKWASIDNDDSLDLDQLSVAESLAGSEVRVLVAIADVDALVKLGSAIDRHAAINTTSVYTAGGVFPMLPEKLSTNLTSLNDREERRPVVIEMTVSAEGDVTKGAVYPAIVVNHAKLAYNAVAAWLDGIAAMPPKVAAVDGLDELLRLQDRIAQTMRARRRAKGALGLETNESRPVFEDGTLVDLRPDEKNRAKELIEEFMVAGNGVTARFLDEKGFPSIRRILRKPKRWERLVAMAAALGHRLPDEPDPLALDKFLDARRKADPANFPELSLCVVKLLGSGAYEMTPPGDTGEGHFGLATEDYVHSTAPNRRYPDLITQRLLKSAIGGTGVPYSDDQLKGLAGQCTLQEDNAAKAERQVRKSAAALLLVARIGARFDAIVTGASEKGTWVRIPKPMVEGKLVRGFEGLDVGDHLRVQLAQVDVVRGFIDFVRIPNAN